MGCSNTTPTSSPAAVTVYPYPHQNGKKTVVVVGYSIAGYTIGEAVWDDANVVFIDARDHFEYVPTNIKSSVDQGWKDKITVTYAESEQGYNGKFKFVQGSLLNVNGDGKTIEVQLADKRKVNLPYDVLVLATGFKYESPIKTEGVVTITDRKAKLDEFHNQVKAAKNIAVVGGGIVGVELAGEIAFHPQASEKKINLIVRGDKLLKQVHSSAHEHADKFLKEKNVNIHYNTTYTEALKKKEGYDLVLVCDGQRYQAPFLKKSFGSSVAKNGQIWVNDYFQVTAVDPTTNGKSAAVKDNIFAFGDICRTSMNEVKNIPSIKFLRQFIAPNVKAVINGQAPTTSIPKKIPVFVAISIGPTYGMYVQNDSVYAAEGNGSGKFSFSEDYIKIWKGAHDVAKGQQAYLESTYADLAKQF